MIYVPRNLYGPFVCSRFTRNGRSFGSIAYLGYWACLIVRKHNGHSRIWTKKRYRTQNVSKPVRTYVLCVFQLCIQHCMCSIIYLYDCMCLLMIAQVCVCIYLNTLDLPNLNRSGDQWLLVPMDHSKSFTVPWDDYLMLSIEGHSPVITRQPLGHGDRGAPTSRNIQKNL